MAHPLHLCSPGSSPRSPCCSQSPSLGFQLPPFPGAWSRLHSLCLQVAFKVLVFDVLMDEDGATGDQYGPYDPEFVEEERQRRREVCSDFRGLALFIGSMCVSPDRYLLQERKNRTAGLQAKEERRRAARSGSSRPVIEATPAPSAPSKAPAAATSAGWDDDSDDEDI